MSRRRIGESDLSKQIDTGQKEHHDLEEGNQKSMPFKKLRYPKRCMMLMVFLTIAIVFVNTGLGSVLQYLGYRELINEALARSETIMKGRVVTVGAVAGDYPECTKIGRDILLQHGSAVDSAIATLMCLHSVIPHNCGIGGGVLMTIFDPKEKKSVVIDGKAVSPAAGHNEVRTKFRSIGPYSIAVPGELMGYWEAHKRFGKLSWKSLFQPAIAMLERGVGMTADGIKSMSAIKAKLARLNRPLEEFYPDISEIFCDENNETKKEGDIIHRHTYLQTLRHVAEEGVDYLYKGEGARMLVSDLQEKGSIITLDDMKNYKANTLDSLSIDFGDVRFDTAGDHYGGRLLAFILKALKGYNITKESFTPENEVKTFHLITEVFKFAHVIHCVMGDATFHPNLDKIIARYHSDEFIQKVHEFIDENKTQANELYKEFVMEDAKEVQDDGTTHLSILGPDGDAVSVTSSINHYYGALIYSKKTGILLNNFNTAFNHTSKYNSMEPGKRPSSGVAPTIFFKDGKVFLVIGSSGGGRIAQSISMVLMNLLWLNRTLEESIAAKRYYYDAVFELVMYEGGFPEHILEKLRDDYGHAIKERQVLISAVQAVYKDPVTGEIIAQTDKRKNGQPSFVQKTILPDML